MSKKIRTDAETLVQKRHSDRSKELSLAFMWCTGSRSTNLAWHLQAFGWVLAQSFFFSLPPAYRLQSLRFVRMSLATKQIIYINQTIYTLCILLSLSLSSYLSLDMVVQDKSVSGSSRRAGLSCAECRRSVSLTLLNPWNHLTQWLDQSSNVIGMLRKSYIFS